MQFNLSSVPTYFYLLFPLSSHWSKEHLPFTCSDQKTFLFHNLYIQSLLNTGIFRTVMENVYYKNTIHPFQNFYTKINLLPFSTNFLTYSCKQRITSHKLHHYHTWPGPPSSLKYYDNPWTYFSTSNYSSQWSFQTRSCHSSDQRRHWLSALE